MTHQKKHKLSKAGDKQRPFGGSECNINRFKTVGERAHPNPQRINCVSSDSLPIVSCDLSSDSNDGDSALSVIIQWLNGSALPLSGGHN